LAQAALAALAGWWREEAVAATPRDAPLVNMGGCHLGVVAVGHGD